MIRLMFPAVLALQFAALSGCQEDVASGLTVHGKVTCNGKPLSGAIVTLDPMSGTSGPIANTAVFDGEFNIGADAGLHGGKYVARFSMLPPEMRKILPPEQAAKLPPDNAMIGPEFDANSRLFCELTPNTKNELKFEIEFHR
ncbi:hypothetical protein LF1_26940 [Rubripirellula obstinata]|uniref:Carboxypeptidase regulatory-like domain-containing protein n=1 Tax=Rubripirellula obstinata TaxID=406547 RepID=A0A5B1CJQ2_9BACT|nr:hypothetical protein [Rubripirellula obstinata]KAA1260155.1 hypothetical protein LF1_26940 [Rubripirellula obstinata]